jgi:hypothetical protein
MHETYRILAQTAIDERLREAAEERRAAEARPQTRAGHGHRLPALLSRVAGNHRRTVETADAPPATAAAALSADGACCA